MKRLSIICVMGYVVSGGVAHAASYYVSAAGRDSNPGTAALPFLTINNGVSRIHAGDTLWVRAGVYDESLIYNVPSGTSWTNKVRIAAFPGETVTLRPTSGNFVMAFGGTSNNGTTGEQKYIEIDGINMDGDGGIAHDEVRIEAGPGYNAHHIRLQNLKINGNTRPSQEDQTHPGTSFGVLVVGLRTDAIGFNEFINLEITGGPNQTVGNDFSNMIYINTPDNLIENCLIHHGIGAAILIYNSNIPGSQPDRQVIRNNIIRDFIRSSDTRGDGILVVGNGHQIYNNLIYNIAHAGNPSAGIQIYGGSNTAVYNNTVYGNAASGILVDSDASDTTVVNNISYGNGVDYVDRGGNTTMSANLFSVDPLFVNAGAGEFRLQPVSPAIGAGTAVALVTTDLNGTHRPQGAAYDIGAYEWQAPASGPPPVPTVLHIIKN